MENEHRGRGTIYFVYRLASAMLVFALVAIPSGAQDDHQAFHHAIELWINHREDDALAAIEESTAYDKAISDDTRGTLHDLSARILLAKARSGIGGEERRKILARAEYAAARAISAAPMDIACWRDYMTIAEEARGEARILDTLGGAWRYHGSVPEIYTMVANDRRVIATAIVESLHGRDSDAVARLEEFVSNADDGGDNCAPRIILAELEFGLDRTEAARSAITGMSEDCRSRVPAINMSRRIAAAEAPLTRFPGANHSDDNQLGAGSRPMPATAPYRENLDVHGSRLNTLDEHRADAENVVLQDPTRLACWYTLWVMLRFDASSQREYDKVIALASRLSDVWQIDVARLYADLARGEFERSRTLAEKVLKRYPDDPHVNAALVLSGAALGGGVITYHSALDKVQSSNPYLAGCLQTDEINRCLERDPTCVLGAIVCSKTQEFVLEAFDHGWPNRFPLQLKRYVDWGLNSESVARINGVERLKVEMAAHASEQNERFDALSTRVDLAIVPTIEDLKNRVNTIETGQAQFATALDQERHERRKEIERMAHDFNKLILGTNNRITMTQADIAHLSLRLAADGVALTRPTIDGLTLPIDVYTEQHPVDAATVAKSITAQVRTVRSDYNSADMFNDIVEDCGRSDSRSAPCLRSIVKMAQKHIRLEMPIIPAVVSVDVLGVCDTVLEFLDKVLPHYEAVTTSSRSKPPLDVRPRLR